MSAVAKDEDLLLRIPANFLPVAKGINTGPLLEEILRQPELWNKNPCRLSRFGPHHETQDMFLRYRDETPFIESGDWSTFSDEHISTWNKTIDLLPAARPLIFELIAHRPRVARRVLRQVQYLLGEQSTG